MRQQIHNWCTSVKIAQCYESRVITVGGVSQAMKEILFWPLTTGKTNERGLKLAVTKRIITRITGRSPPGVKKGRSDVYRYAPSDG